MKKFSLVLILVFWAVFVGGAAMSLVGCSLTDDSLLKRIENLEQEKTDALIWKGSLAAPPASPSKNWAYHNTVDNKVYVYDGLVWNILVQDGTNGSNGLPGITVIWKGNLGAAPNNPQLNWAYYNETDNASYIWDGSTWQVFAIDGVAGNDGLPGVSVVWKGNLSSAPANPQVNWAYYNSTDKIAYIWDGSTWSIVAKDGVLGLSNDALLSTFNIAGFSPTPAFSPSTFIYDLGELWLSDYKTLTLSATAQHSATHIQAQLNGGYTNPIISGLTSLNFPLSDGASTLRIETQSQDASQTQAYTVSAKALRSKQWGTANYDQGNGVALDASGNMYVAGYANGPLDGQTSAGVSDIFLTKFNAGGIKQWTRQLGTSSQDGASGVSVDSIGNIFVAGFTNGALDGQASAGDYDVILIKYDTTGTKIWTRQWGTASSDSANGIAIDPSGNIYVAGNTSGALDGQTSAGGLDGFLTKFDSSGTKIWTRQWGGAANENAKGLGSDSSGNIFVCGDTSGSFDGQTSAGGTDMFLIKYNSAGVKQVTQMLGTTAYDTAVSVSADPYGYVFVAGHTSGAFVNQVSSGAYDVFLARYIFGNIFVSLSQWGTKHNDFASGLSAFSVDKIYMSGTTAGELDGQTSNGGVDFFMTRFDSMGSVPIKKWTRQWGSELDDEARGVTTRTSILDGTYAIVTGSTGGSVSGHTNAGAIDIVLSKFTLNGD